jgi:hypothetical protein
MDNKKKEWIGFCILFTLDLTLVNHNWLQKLNAKKRTSLQTILTDFVFIISIYLMIKDLKKTQTNHEMHNRHSM